jgi:Leucine-rich repeat (LRR) protein
MDKLGKDTLFLIGLELDLPDLLRFCSSNTKINNLICKKDYIWLNMLKRDFKNYKNYNLLNMEDVSPKALYILLYNLKRFKNFLKEINFGLSKEEIYNLREIDLSNRSIRIIPKEIGVLTNLKSINLSRNLIETLPKEINNLINLEELDASDNILEEVNIWNLKKLKKLSLKLNDYLKIKIKIWDLKNLTKLNLSYNGSNKLANEIGNLTNLEFLNLSYNNLEDLPKEIENLVHLKLINIKGNIHIEKGIPTPIRKLMIKQKKLSLPEVRVIDKYNKK